MVSRWAGDATVQAAMVSCLPSHLLSKQIIPIGGGERQGSAGLKEGRGAGAGASPVAAQAKDENNEERSQRQEQQEGDDEAAREDHPVQGNLTLANLVVWFREFMTVLDDDAVGGGGGGGEGSWGSRPPRLLRVIEQRAGCAQEAVQLFVSLCRGLGLRARYVACLDPVPPTPATARLPAKQTRHNTVDLAKAAVPASSTAGRQQGGGSRAHQGRSRWGGSRNARASGSGVGARASQAWAEVLCRGGDELYVVTEPEPEPTPPGRHQPAAGKPKQGRSSSEPLSLTSDNEDGGGGRTARGGPEIPDDATVGVKKRQRRTQSDTRPAVGEDEGMAGGATPFSDGSETAGRLGTEAASAARGAAAARAGEGATPTRSGSKRKAAVAASASIALGAKTANGRARKGSKQEKAAAAAAAAAADDDDVDDFSAPAAAVAAMDAAKAEARVAGKNDGFGVNDGNPAGSDGDAAGTAAREGGERLAANGASGSGGGGSRKRMRNGRDAAAGAGGSSAGSSGASVGAAVLAVASPSSGTGAASGAGATRERWTHVDPVQGAVDQADKVQDMRFRKRLIPYVVAEDEKKVIVDVTRRYSSEWARTLRTRGRAMASPDGWWNQALRQWRAAAATTATDGHNRRRKAGTGTAGSPLVVEEEVAHAANGDDPSASEEKELEAKVNNEPVPSTIAALKNHHVYVLGKNLLKFEALRPGARAAGLVKGSKVYLKTDVAKLRGASRWKKDALQVKKSELEKPAKIATKKGEKDGEGTSKLYGDWQTEPWVPEAAANGKVPKNEYGNVEFFDCSPAFLPPGTAHVRGDQISRVASQLGVDYAPALTGFETKQGRQVPVLDGIIVCKEQSQMLRDAHTAWEQTLLEKRAKAREQKVLRRWRTLFKGVLLGAQLLEEYGDHD
ncbi:unnamed protein product [Scytosiphon promiscuus]